MASLKCNPERAIKAAYLRLAELGEQLEAQLDLCASLSQIRYPLFKEDELPTCDADRHWENRSDAHCAKGGAA